MTWPTCKQHVVYDSLALVVPFSLLLSALWSMITWTFWEGWVLLHSHPVVLSSHFRAQQVACAPTILLQWSFSPSFIFMLSITTDPPRESLLLHDLSSTHSSRYSTSGCILLVVVPASMIQILRSFFHVRDVCPSSDDPFTYLDRLASVILYHRYSMLSGIDEEGWSPCLGLARHHESHCVIMGHVYDAGHW